MKYNKPKDNRLINRKGMLKVLKSEGAERISPEATALLEKKILIQIKRMAPELMEKALINGRKTIKKQDIEEIFEEKNKYWEI